MSDLNKLTIKQALDGLKKGDFTSIDLTTACLAQIERLNPEINAFITVRHEAIEDAKKADESRKNGVEKPLLGIPIALKDIFMTEGIKTTATSNILKDYIPQYDASVVKNLKTAGAIIVGKTNMDAWAHGSSGENSDFGPTRNPWNTKYVPGGSSSGSAVSVASNMAFAATGTDTGGSIRLPASFNNVVGLKPTYGLVSRYGVIAMASSLDSIGHFTKTVEDSAIILNITAGRDEFDATTKNSPEDYTKDLGKDIKGLKIGSLKKYLNGADENIKKLTLDVEEKLQKLGAEIIDIDLPHSEYAIAAYYIIQPAEVSSNLARYDGIRFGEERSHFGEEAKRRIMLGTFTLSSGYYDAYYKKAMKIKTLIKQDFDKAFEKVDAIISPVSPTPPWKLGEKVNDPLKMYLSDIFTVTANLAGIPGLSIPAGFIKDNLPIGIQLLGAHFSESLLFQIGYALEKTQERRNFNI